MIDVKIDDVKYVPEESVTNEMRLKQVCGSTVSAKVSGHELYVMIDGITVALFDTDQRVYLRGKEKWRNQNIQGGEGTETRDTLNQMITSVGMPSNKGDSIRVLFDKMRKDGHDWQFRYHQVGGDDPLAPNNVSGTWLWVPCVYVEKPTKEVEPSAMNGRHRLRLTDVEPDESTCITVKRLSDLDVGDTVYYKGGGDQWCEMFAKDEPLTINSIRHTDRYDVQLGGKQLRSDRYDTWWVSNSYSHCFETDADC